MRKDGDLKGKDFLGKGVNQHDCKGHVDLGEQKKVVPAHGCNSACPICITRSCILKPEHYGKCECSEGHTWW